MAEQQSTVDDAIRAAALSRRVDELSAIVTQLTGDNSGENSLTFASSIPVGKVRKAINDGNIKLSAHGENKGQAFRDWKQSFSGLGNEFQLLNVFMKDAQNSTDTPVEENALLTRENDDMFLACLKLATKGYARELLEDVENTLDFSGRNAFRALEEYCNPKTFSEKLAMACGLTHKLPMPIPLKGDPKEALTKYNRAVKTLKRLYDVEILQVQQVGAILFSLPKTYDDLKKKIIQKSHDPGISLEELTEKIQSFWSSFLNPETNGDISSVGMTALSAVRNGINYGRAGVITPTFNPSGAGRGGGRGRGVFGRLGRNGGRGEGRGAGSNNAGAQQLKNAQVKQRTHERAVKAAESKTCFICRQPGHVAPDCPQRQNKTQPTRRGMTAIRAPESPLVTLLANRSQSKKKTGSCSNSRKHQRFRQSQNGRYPLEEVGNQRCVLPPPAVVQAPKEWNHNDNRANYPAWYKDYLAGYIESQLSAEYGSVVRQPCCGCVSVHTTKCVQLHANGSRPDGCYCLLCTKVTVVTAKSDVEMSACGDAAQDHFEVDQPAAQPVTEPAQIIYSNFAGEVVRPGPKLYTVATETYENTARQAQKMEQLMEKFQQHSEAVEKRLAAIDHKAKQLCKEGASRRDLDSRLDRLLSQSEGKLAKKVRSDTAAGQDAMDDSDCTVSFMQELFPYLDDADERTEAEAVAAVEAAGLLTAGASPSTSQPRSSYAGVAKPRPVVELPPAYNPGGGSDDDTVDTCSTTGLNGLGSGSAPSGESLQPGASTDDDVDALTNQLADALLGLSTPKRRGNRRGRKRQARQELTSKLFSENSPGETLGGKFDTAVENFAVETLGGKFNAAAENFGSSPTHPSDVSRAPCALVAHVTGAKDVSHIATVLDSGANACMFKDKDCFVSIDESRTSEWTVADGRAKLASAGTGTVIYPVVNSVTGSVVHLELDGVCYCPSAAFNLLSVSELEDQHGIYCDFAKRVAASRDGRVQLEIVRCDAGSTYHLVEPDAS